MLEIKAIFDKLQLTNGKIDKENILKDNKKNELLKGIITFVYNPFILSGLSKKKINKELYIKPNDEVYCIHQAMEYLKLKNTGRDTDIATIQSFINSEPNELHELYKSIFTKSLKLGCDAKTFNKVWGKGFIPKHEVQQAYSLEKVKLKSDEWISLSVKLNGFRGSFINGKIISRQGHEIEGLDHIINDIQQLGLSDKFVDGELIRKNINNVSDNENFRISGSIINSEDIDKSEIQFVIFDVLESSDFLDGESSLTYKDRLKFMGRLQNICKESDLDNIDFVEVLYSGTDHSKIKEYLDLVDVEDKEGLMLNRNTTYKCKRHNGILKVKRFNTMDLKVVDIEEGEGRLKGALGALVVDFKGGRVNVGSGYDDETRAKIWSMNNKIIGRVIEVKYKEISENKLGIESLQFPVFVRIREEGKDVSYS